jgi:hypothetical protein
MTWAQGTFAFSFGILVPTVGILSAIGLKREGKKSWLKGLLVGSGAVIIALCACGLLAALLFPEYPRKRVPELLANAFTLPAAAAGVGAIWFVSKARAESKRFCILASAAVLVVYVVGLAISYQVFTWPFRKALPWSAKDVHEWYMTDGLLPDYSYQLKARVTEEQFRRYIARFGLTPHTSTRNYSDLTPCLSWDSAPEFEDGWWDPSDSLDSTYVRQVYHTWTFAKFERGYLYLGSLDH